MSSVFYDKKAKRKTDRDIAEKGDTQYEQRSENYDPSSV